jgi:geranylgeranyl diphosphate synthase type II
MNDLLETTFNRWRFLINRELEEADLFGAEQSTKLYEAASYVLRGEGKRLRAMLTLATFADIMGDSSEVSLPLIPAVSVEILHAASLVHDDLPALDNDDERRGRPSCHKVYGDATAILVGDLLVGVAVARLISASSSALQQTLLQQMLATTWAHICIGQHLDIVHVTDPLKKQTMIELKTGALFGAAMACGAICANVSSEIVQQMYQVGVRIGVNFQKLDDIHDGDRAQSELKDIRSDLEDLITSLDRLCGKELILTEGVVATLIEI